LALRHTIVDGDILHLPLTNGRLQAVEAHRLRTPNRTKKNVMHGVLLEEESAKRLEYWITKEDLDPLQRNVLVSDIQAYAARDENGDRQVFHLYDPKRVSQRRGVTAFAPCVDPIGMHDDLQFATLVKAMVASCFAIFEEQELDPKGNGRGKDKPVTTGNETLDTLSDGTTRTVQGASPGMRVRGKPGVSFKGFAPNIPNPEFFPHATLILSFIAINLDMPICVLMLDPSNTNFSGYRGALDQARARWRQIQNWLRYKFHRRIYRWKVRQWLSEDAAMREVATRGDIDVFAHTWNCPTWDYIEPMKDAAADLLQERNLLISRRRRAARRGFEWKDLSTEIVEDNALILQKAFEKWQALKKQFPDWDLTWREVVSLPTPDGIQLSLDTAQSDGQPSGPPPGTGAGKTSA
jgi:capsid protein